MLINGCRFCCSCLAGAGSWSLGAFGALPKVVSNGRLDPPAEETSFFGSDFFAEHLLSAKAVGFLLARGAAGGAGSNRLEKKKEQLVKEMIQI